MNGNEERDSIGLGTPPPEEFSRTREDLERFRQGDGEAFDRLWERYRPALEVWIAGKVRTRLDPSLIPRLEADREDILQEVAITVFRRLGDFEYRGRGSVLAWMSRIATNAVGDRVEYWRAGKRHPGLDRVLPGGGGTTTGAPGGGPALADPGPGPSTLADQAEHRRRLAAALATLSEREHTILFWRYFGGAEWAEIAGELGAESPDAVRMECYLKALPALAAALAALPPDPGPPG